MPKTSANNGGNTHEYKDYLDFERSFGAGKDITPDEVSRLCENMRVSLENKPKKKSWEKAMLSVSGGDSSVLEVASKKHENLAYLACLDQLCKQLEGNFPLDKSKPIGPQLAELTDNKEFRAYAVQHNMDPMFRKGLHAAEQMTRSADGKETDVSRKLANADSQLNKSIMMRTLAAPTDIQLQNLKQTMDAQGKDKEFLDTVLKNQEQQRILAKMLFMAHVAGAKVSNNGSKTSGFQGNMCDLLTHGGRVMVTLPAGNQQQKQFDAILGSPNGDSAGVFGRVFATHGVTNATLNADGSVKKAGKEYKPRGPGHADIHKNYGMNLSVGGLGAKGVRDVTVQPDGSSGHAYMKMIPGGGSSCGAMLFGVESSAPGKSSQLGQTHDAKAVKSKQTAFLSNKNVQGDSLGGRTIDFSQMDGSTFVSLMQRFDAYYSKLQNDPEALKKFNTMLCGKQMAPLQIASLLNNQLGIDQKQSNKIVSQLREPHVKMDERVKLDAPSKEPERPNFFKRWFRSMSKSWQAENEAYAEHIKARQAERIRKQNALDDALNAVPKDWDTNTAVQTGTVISKFADIANTSLSAYDRENALAMMAHALDRAAAKSNYTNLDNLEVEWINPAELDQSKVMNTPTFRYLTQNKEPELREIMADSKTACQKMSDLVKEMVQDFTLSGEEAKNSREKMRELFNKLNVPGLEKRSQAYQDMVAAVERAANSRTPSGEDSLRVFNAVQAYAGAKNAVPSTEAGKKSLSLAYQALNAALPEKSREKLTKEMKPRMEALDRAMKRAPEQNRTVNNQQAALVS